MSARNKGATAFARSLRKKDNDAEAALWSELRDRRLHNYKFVREWPIGRYFADFACRRKKLVIEVDGSHHVGSLHDQERDTWLNHEGWSIVRFNNILVLKEREAVLSTIVDVLERRIWAIQESVEWQFWPARKAMQ